MREGRRPSVQRREEMMTSSSGFLWTRKFLAIIGLLSGPFVAIEF